MARIDPSIPGNSFTQSSAEIQEILNNVAGLSNESVSELIGLLNEIKNINTDPDDDAQSIGQQLLAVLDSMVKEDEVQIEVNDSTYPPQSKAVKTVLEAHKNAPELDHADGSVKARHIADNAIATTQLRDNIITASKLRPKIISETHLVDSLQTKINNAIDEEILLKYASIISTAPKYKLSDLHRDADIGYDFPCNLDDYFILKNDTRETYDTEILWNEVHVWETTKPIRNGKTYLCILRDLVDTGDDVFRDGKIEVVTEMGSDIIDLQTASKGWNGTWKYGTDLTHTEGRVSSDEIPNVKAGDYYLNSETYSVYHTDNGTDWLYIGNLTGSVDTSKWAPINSPVFTGFPMADTPEVTNNSNQIATTKFVRSAIDTYVSNNNSGTSSGDTVSNPNIKNITVTSFSTQSSGSVLNLNLTANSIPSANEQYYYKISFDDIDSIVNELSDGAGSTYSVYINNTFIKLTSSGESSGSQLEKFFPQLNSHTLYLNYNSTSGIFESVSSDIVNNPYKYADYKVKRAKSEVEAKITALRQELENNNIL